MSGAAATRSSTQPRSWWSSASSVSVHILPMISLVRGMTQRGPTTFEPEFSHVFRSSFPHVEDLGFRTATWLVANTGDELRPLHPTLLHALAHAAKLEDRVGITLLPDDDKLAETRLSYRGLYLEARALAAVLEARG